MSFAVKIIAGCLLCALVGFTAGVLYSYRQGSDQLIESKRIASELANRLSKETTIRESLERQLAENKRITSESSGIVGELEKLSSDAGAKLEAAIRIVDETIRIYQEPGRSKQD